MDRYERLKVLGQGSYGVAVLARRLPRRHNSPNALGTLHVIKEIDMSQMPPQARKEAKNEVEVLRSLSHTNVVAYVATFLEADKLCIVMEFADAGDLGEELKSRKTTGQTFSDAEAMAVFTQCCMGLQHTHSRHVLHRDLKCQNIFLTRAGIVKLGDWGIARALDHTTAKVKTMVGTPYYTAPEVCDSVEYGLKADIWSMGVVLYEMLAMEPPFQAPNLVSLVLKILRQEPKPLPETRSEEIRRVVRLTLQKKPESRPSSEALLALPALRAALGARFVPSAPAAAAALAAALAPAPGAAPAPEPRAACAIGGAAGPRKGEAASRPVSRPIDMRRGNSGSFVLLREEPYRASTDWQAQGLPADPADAVEELLSLLAAQAPPLSSRSGCAAPRCRPASEGPALWRAPQQLQQYGGSEGSPPMGAHQAGNARGEQFIGERTSLPAEKVDPPCRVSPRRHRGRRLRPRRGKSSEHCDVAAHQQPSLGDFNRASPPKCGLLSKPVLKEKPIEPPMESVPTDVPPQTPPRAGISARERPASIVAVGDSELLPGALMDDEAFSELSGFWFCSPLTAARRLGLDVGDTSEELAAAVPELPGAAQLPEAPLLRGLRGGRVRRLSAAAR